MASLGLSAHANSFDWRKAIPTPAAVLAIWAIWSLGSITLASLKGPELAGPDDWMRLFQVRDWLAGQNWFDVTQYRVAPPLGAAMHWSRLVDIPLAAAILFFDLFLPRAAAELSAAMLLPLIWLLTALFALRAIALRLGFSPLATLFVLVGLPFFPLLAGNFAPMHIDHHVPQAALAIVCAALMLRAPSRRSAAACGIAAAAWLVISLEALPLVVLLAGLYGVRYWHSADRSLAWFLTALAVAAAALSLATRPLSELDGSWCDVVLPAHNAGFAIAAAIAALFPFVPAQDRPVGRLAALVSLLLVCAPLALAGLGQCATGPFSSLDPLVKAYWYDYVSEGLPVWLQVPSIAVTLIWSVPVVVVGWWIGSWRGTIAAALRLDWLLLALFALGAAAYSLAVMREGLVAQLLAIPFAAVLLADMWPRARAIPSIAPRMVATLGAIAVAVPAPAGALLKYADRLGVEAAVPARALARAGGEPCDYTRLGALTPGLVFTTTDKGPEILAHTNHSIVAAGYHRNQKSMRKVLQAFTGDARRAENLVRETGADYVVACASEKDLVVFREARRDNLANLLIDGPVPAWLRPEPGFEDGSLRVYRVK